MRFASDNPWSLTILAAFGRLASGGFAVRQLYTDQDEVLFDAVRPVILNGIEGVITRPGLADRALFLTLPRHSAALARQNLIMNAGLLVRTSIMVAWQFGFGLARAPVEKDPSSLSI